MLANPLIKETIIPTIKSVVIIDGFDMISGSLIAAAPKIIGVDNKKENRADASLVNPVSNPVVMVTPERETPGIIAIA